MLAEVTTATVATPTGISEELWLGATAGLSALSATDGSTSSITSSSAATSVSDFLDTLTTSKPTNPTAARRYKMWSSGDTQTLMRMVSEKQPWHEIAVACGHPESGCRDKYLRLAGLSAIGYRRFSGATVRVGRIPTWKPEETQTLVRMVNEYRSWDEIQAACNHSKGACRSKYIRQTGKNPPLLTGWPSQAKHTQPRRQIMSSMYANMEPLHVRMELSPPIPPPPPTPSQSPPTPPPTPSQSPPTPPPTPSQSPPTPPPTPSQSPPMPPPPIESQPKSPPTPPPPTESQLSPPLTSYPRPQPLPPKPLPHQQQFVANVNTLATKMCTKLDPKAMQLCNAMFQFLMTVMPEEVAGTSS